MPAKAVKPSDRFYAVAKNANKLSTIIGVNFLSKSFEYRPTTYMTIVLMIGFYMFTIWTMVNEGMKDWKNIIASCTMLNIGPQSSAKLYTALHRVYSIKKMIYLCRDIYRCYENKSERYFKVLNKNIDRAEKILKYIRIGYITSFAGLIVAPHIFLLLNGQRTLVMQYQIPGLDIETDMGYFLTNGLQSLSLTVTGFGFYAGDLFVIIFITQSFLFADVFQLKVEDVNQLLLKQQETKASSKEAQDLTQKEVTALLIDLVQWHQLYTKYTDYVNDLCYLVITTQVLSSAFSIIMTLFALLALGGHLSQLIHLIVIVYCMIIYCLLGTQIEYFNDLILYEAYNVEWAQMNVEQRKMVRLMLLKTQRPNEIKILGIMPLSVQTVLEISKFIYSMTMMMTQFI